MPNYFNSNLKYIREKNGISKTDMAKIVNVHQSTITRWEKGDMGATIDNAIDASNALSIPLPILLGKDMRFDNADYLEINTDTELIPVLGIIKAGIPIEAQENILEYVDIPKKWLKGDKKFFGLKISGDSMFPKYIENDIVIFEQTNDYITANKKDCAVLVNGDDATFKNVSISENGITLVPLNPNNSDGYQATFYSKEDIEKIPVKIIGIAREKRTRL